MMPSRQSSAPATRQTKKEFFDFKRLPEECRHIVLKHATNLHFISDKWGQFANPDVKYVYTTAALYVILIQHSAPATTRPEHRDAKKPWALGNLYIDRELHQEAMSALYLTNDWWFTDPLYLERFITDIAARGVSHKIQGLELEIADPRMYNDITCQWLIVIPKIRTAFTNLKRVLVYFLCTRIIMRFQGELMDIYYDADRRSSGDDAFHAPFLELRECIKTHLNVKYLKIEGLRADRNWDSDKPFVPWQRLEFGQGEEADYNRRRMTLFDDHDTV